MSDKDKVFAAFDTLTPAMQTAVAVIIFELANKDMEISRMAKEIHRLLEDL